MEELSHEQLKELEKKTKSRAKAKKVVAAILATLTGVSAMTVVSSVIAYDAFFTRYERPDYALYPGEYCYSRVQSRLTRKEFFYRTDESHLKGYYYPSTQGKGLVVVAHGYHAGADDYIPAIEYFVNNGYNVFAYDCQGTYDSYGEGTVGMCQSLVDLDGTLTYLSNTAPYCNQKLFLFGHSWGGYAVSSVLALHDDIRAAACIAPMNNGSTIMVEKGEQYAGKIASMSKPLFDAYQTILFGDYVNYNGVKGINSVDIPVLIAHGVDDTIITYDKQSITAHKAEITNPNVRYYEGYGAQGGHDSIWHSKESVAYKGEIDGRLKKLQMERGRDLTAQEKADFLQDVDHALYSAINPTLFAQILEMFDSQI